MSLHLKRLIPLEAYRGIAAFIVLIHHFFLGFSPSTTGYTEESRTSYSLIGQPYFVFFNGDAAVAFFFTLSGFVLCWSYFNHQNPNRLLLAFLKRFPRLAGIVTISTTASYILFKFNFYHFQEAAQISISPWLASFANSEWTVEFDPNFWDAITQGLTTFFTGSMNYNSNLWTMNSEFFGSMIVFMLACLISNILRYRYLLYTFIIISVSAIHYAPYIFSFVVGTFLSVYQVMNNKEITTTKAILMIIAGLYMLGYMIPEKSYTWVKVLPEFIQASLHTFGSASIILATLANKPIFNKLNGRFFKLLGKLSFPLYLVHTLVICSASSYLYLQMKKSGSDNQITLVMVFLTTVLISVLVSIPLSRFDDWWVKSVNTKVSQILEKNSRLS
jgi:peptidoglycan/LPS O-acetylase OafA/YrhL